MTGFGQQQWLTLNRRRLAVNRQQLTANRRQLTDNRLQSLSGWHSAEV